MHESIYFGIDFIVSTLYAMFGLLQMLTSTTDVESLITVLALVFIAVYSVMKLLEIETIFKNMLFILAIFALFANIEMYGSVNVYLVSTLLGIIFLIIISVFTKYEDAKEYA
ncbi:MAG: hypothetical protein OQK48_04190 [Sulfurimonas sp.]|uniref:hypothetical protein n=1 Tax=Sulfurimonas sp. TaxID=2022749 RepID=UPI00260D7EB7|nr:hypothetical protein [Sulfurimonas sp.]MCW8896289.1 hypothetical protein [Sulfurimonas sp.]MCW8954120.1 hypothetical protein [Sulfurimonas sp.]MCW9068404.1 hypothetical protein [Sulfurimonas sp.]